MQACLGENSKASRTDSLHRRDLLGLARSVGNREGVAPNGTDYYSESCGPSEC